MMHDNERNENQRIAEENSYEEDYSHYYNQPEHGVSVGKIVVALLVLFGVVGVLAIQYPKFVGKIAGHKIHSVSAAEGIEEGQEQNPDENNNGENPDGENMGDYFFNEAGGGDDQNGEMIAEGGGEENQNLEENNNGEENQNWEENNNNGEEEQNWDENNNGEENYENSINFENNEDNSIMVNLGVSGRKNPFLPHPKAAVSKNANADFPVVPFEIIEPPTTVSADPAINKLLETKITGILYDNVSPSAVVVIDGVDEFVKVGDKIWGYTITQITRDKVVIAYGSNTLTASIGQLFSKDEMTGGRVISNLERKFGGSRR